MHHRITLLNKLDLVHRRFHCITPSTLVICGTMPSLLSIFRALLLLVIYISNIGSLVILRLLIFASTAGTFVILSAVSSMFALLVFPVVISYKRFSDIGNPKYLITFGALCLLDLPSCITLPLRALQNNGIALCQDLSQSGDCTLAHVLIGCYYMAVICAIVGFVITYIDRRTGGTPKVSPRYPNPRTAGPPFAAFQYSQDVELENVFIELPTRKAKQAHAERLTTSSV